jgi:hypothetical protein
MPLALFAILFVQSARREDGNMTDFDDYLTKTNAIGYICVAAGCGRPTAEKALRELQAAGRITLVKPAFTHAYLITRADMDSVIAYIRQGLKATEASG